MTIGVCIIHKDKNTLKLYEGFTNFGFLTYVATEHKDLHTLQSLKINQKQLIIYNDNIMDILDRFIPMNIALLVTVDNITVNFGHPVLFHVTFITNGDNFIRIIFEPNKPISRSYNITNDFSSWEPFVISCIEENSLPSLTTINKTTYCCKSTQQSFQKFINKQYSKSLNYTSCSSIKPLWNFSYDSDVLINKWSRYINDKNWKLTTNNHEFFLVINQTFIPIEPSKTFYFMMEPYGERLYSSFLQQIGSHLYFYGCHRYHLNNCEWHIQSPRNSVEDKPKGLTIVVSNRNADPGQKYRLQVVKKLDELANDCGFPIEIYGKCGNLGFKNYKGELPEYSKDIALNKYQYHFNAENNQIDNYITEKLYDSILCDCYTFYWGAKNINQYFDMNSITTLTGDIDKDVSTIISTIKNDTYNSIDCKESIKNNKEKILNVYAMNHRLTSIWETINSILFIYNKDGMNVEKTIEHCTNQSFKSVNIVQFPLGDPTLRWIYELCTISLQHFMHCIIAIEHVTDMLFQTCSTSYALAKEADIILKSTEIGKTNIIIRCSGCEKVIINVHKGKSGPSIFDGCKIAKINI